MKKTRAPSSPARWWWLAGSVLTVVAVAAVTAVIYVTTRTSVGQPQAAPPPGLSPQELLTSSMRSEPVPGWKTSAQELGLPPGGVVKAITNLGDRGYFLGITGTGWWLVGIDVTNGHSSFAPIDLGSAENASGIDCFVNGPTMVLCVRQDRDPNMPAHAWVMNTERGSLTYDGQTELRISRSQDHPVLQQAGDYAVATLNGKGVRGVGPDAEVTWFVPGDGSLSQQKDWEHDTTPQPVAVQGGAANSATDVVFSTSTGQVFNPPVPQGGRFGMAFVYPGGFGYEYASVGGFSWDRVAFFDDSGRELSRPDLEGVLLTGSRDVPIVRTATADVVMTLDGRKLVELPAIVPMRSSRVIGERLFVSSVADDTASWQQYDLRTGRPGRACGGDSLGPYYIASDGEVAVSFGERTPAEGIDLNTCQTLWSFSSSSQSESIDVWRVNTTLIQRTNDELFSLVAPS